MSFPSIAVLGALFLPRLHLLQASIVVDLSNLTFFDRFGVSARLERAPLALCTSIFFEAKISAHSSLHMAEADSICNLF